MFDSVDEIIEFLEELAADGLIEIVDDAGLLDKVYEKADIISEDYYTSPNA